VLKLVRKKRDASKVISLSDFEPDDGINLDFVEDEKNVSLSEDKMSLSRTSRSLIETALVEGEEPVFFSETLLNDRERKLYLRRRADYLEDFTFNRSSDIGLIHRVVMEEIIIERLYASYINEPTKDLSEKMSESLNRYKAAQEALGASRDKRIKNRETGAFSVADLAKSYYEEKKERFERQAPQKSSEEESLLIEMNHSMGLQYEGISENEKTGWEDEDGQE
jgi:hypothetical protein